MNREIKHICLAEDDFDDYYIFSKILHETDCEVKLTWFQTCEDLLEYLNESDLPDLVVLDMNMPKMDGQTCLINIKNEQRLHHIPVIILSTADYPTIISMAYHAGALTYYQKPSSMDELKKIVGEMLAAPIT